MSDCEWQMGKEGRGKEGKRKVKELNMSQLYASPKTYSTSLSNYHGESNIGEMSFFFVPWKTGEYNLL